MRYRQILVPLDGSLLSEYVLPQVEKIATAFESQLTLLHVLAQPDSDGNQLTPSQKRTRANIVEYLQKVQKDFGERGVTTHWTIRCGDPAQEIVWYASQHDIDLVMMSTHGGGSPAGQDVGSVAVAVMRQLSMPILLVGVPHAVAQL